MHKGVPISPGVAVARAYRLDEIPSRTDAGPLDDAAIAAEVYRFQQACKAATEELDKVIERVQQEIGSDEADIFRSHRQLIRDTNRDPVLVAKVKSIIQQKRLNASSALRTVLEEYTVLFAQVEDPYLRERLADIKDVVARIQAHLTAEARPCGETNEPVVLVAPEILPSQAVMFECLPVAGIVTEAGGATGHAAILARSLGIPAVSGLTGITATIHSGDLVIVDGREGVVLLNPGPEVEAAYHKMRREYVDLRDRLIENAHEPAVSADGMDLELLANVNGPADAVTAVRAGAGGVGLYRTEYLFLTHQSVPNEEEQLATYKQVIESSPNQTVTIRTLDLGGDKHVPYLGTGVEANPFMGWRSIRLRDAYPELFRTQLRAILRAGRHGHVQLLFPMISTLEEVRQLKEVVEDTRRELAQAKVPHAVNMPVGIMIEVPAAALCIDQLLDEVDFVSIGSNDLIQYVMAADRDNPKVAHLCEPFSPAIFRLLRHIISACVARNKPVTLCGEMAALPRCFPPLFGMGLRSFSMSPAFVPSIKALAQCVDSGRARESAEKVLKMRTVGEVRGYLTERVQKFCPNVAFLDTTQ
ncbi:MAG TPA: phosphoenolpyruvate--protein phosphotransferase [Gemmataceae bacterium]|jgi:phosphoenolpyruvate-protein phosphotransferase|nr:phosphoenolpyruvate--protein phosphotransferase [Gemmataceae bacterium]